MQFPFKRVYTMAEHPNAGNVEQKMKMCIHSMLNRKWEAPMIFAYSNGISILWWRRCFAFAHPSSSSRWMLFFSFFLRRSLRASNVCVHKEFCFALVAIGFTSNRWCCRRSCLRRLRRRSLNGQRQPMKKVGKSEHASFMLVNFFLYLLHTSARAYRILDTNNIIQQCLLRSRTMSMEHYKRFNPLLSAKPLQFVKLSSFSASSHIRNRLRVAAQLHNVHNNERLCAMHWILWLGSTACCHESNLHAACCLHNVHIRKEWMISLARCESWPITRLITCAIVIRIVHLFPHFHSSSSSWLCLLGDGKMRMNDT